jgi:lysophospholipase L1-like esterase
MNRKNLAQAFWLILAVLSIALPGTAGEAQQPILKPGQRVAVVGDSITEQKQYSRFIEMYLTVCVPQLDLKVMQFGWSGEWARGFAGRMNNDLMPFKPDVVTTCYGMNDGSYRPYDPKIGEAYENPMRDIVTRLKAVGATVVVGSPGAVDTRYWRGGDAAQIAAYNDNLAHLRDIARKVAAEAGMPFANVHDQMIDVMAKAKAVLGADYDVCGRDGVHPGPNGHLIMAYAFLKAMGLDGDIGAITVDITGATTATDGHKILASDKGTVEIESSRYPFCFSGNETTGNLSILPYLPFNDELNRLTLVVKNLDGEKAKVTWGKTAKSFTREQLEKGINLAAEFLDNPFCEQFNKVDALAKTKQNYETFMIKYAITQFPGIVRALDNDKETETALDVMRTKLWEKWETQETAFRAGFVPVKHVLKIEKE